MGSTGGKREKRRLKGKVEPTNWFFEKLGEAQKSPNYWATLLALEVSDVVTAEMSKSSLSLIDLAHHAGLPVGVVKRILTGNVDLRLIDVAKVALALGLEPHLGFHPKGDE